MSSSQELAQRAPIDALVEQVRAPNFLAQLQVALPNHVTPARFARVTVTALRENPDLAGVDRASLFSSLVRCAQDGLLPDGREAALVSFKDKQKGKVAVYMPMIGGFRKSAAEFGWSLRTRVVYENDTFDYALGLDETLTHIPTRPGLERGPMVAAYAVATHKDGRKEIEVLYAEDVEKAKAVSRASNFGPWVEWPERMWEKTAGRRLFAKLPLGEREAERRESLIEADELEPGEAAAALYGPEATAEAPPRGEDGNEQGAGASVEEAEQGHPSSETDGAPAPASAAEPEPDEPIEEGQFTVPDSVEVTPEVAAANVAGEYVLEVGKHKGKTLAQLVESGDGLGYLKYVLRQWKTNPLKDKAWAFALVYAPDLYEECSAASAEEGA